VRWLQEFKVPLNKQSVQVRGVRWSLGVELHMLLQASHIEDLEASICVVFIRYSGCCLVTPLLVGGNVSGVKLTRHRARS
jgi:hypothetical protein